MRPQQREVRGVGMSPTAPAPTPAVPSTRRRFARATGVVAVVAGLVAAVPGAAWAYWTISATSTTAASANSLVAPTMGACGTRTIIFGNDPVKVAWTEPAAPSPALPSGATRSYLVQVVSASGAVVNVSSAVGTTSIEVSPDSVAAPMEKQTITVRTRVVFGSTTWDSAPSAPIAVQGSNLLGYTNFGCVTP